MLRLVSSFIFCHAGLYGHRREFLRLIRKLILAEAMVHSPQIYDSRCPVGHII